MRRPLNSAIMSTCEQQLGTRKARVSMSVNLQLPGEGRAFWLGTDLHIFKAVGEDTNQAFALAELVAQPQFAPPPHIHHREDESYYILEGEFEFLDSDRTFIAGPGSFVYLPKGQLHMHRNVGN